MVVDLLKKVPEMYEHQKEAFRFIENKDQFALFMEMGTGKSKVAIEKAVQLRVQNEIDCVIVISPNAVKDQWVDEQFPEHCWIKYWHGYVWDGANSQKSRNAFHEANTKNGLFVFSVNVEAFQSSSISQYIKMVLRERKVFVIIDESTRIKSGRRKPVKGKRGGAQRTNKITDLFYGIQYKAILTGTPTPNSPFDLWSQFEFVRRDFFRMDFFFFQHHHGIMIKKSTSQGRQYTSTLDEKTYSIVKASIKKLGEVTSQGLQEIAFKNGLKVQDVILINRMEELECYKNLEELRNKISTITFFKKKEDCLDLPDKVFETLHCKMGKEQERLYKELKQKMYAQYQGHELNVTTKLVMSLRLQMITGGLFPYEDVKLKIDKDGEESFETDFEYSYIENGCKVKVLVEDLEEVHKETFIIVWARFRGEIDLIYSKLTETGHTCEKYYGGSSKDVITRFKNKEFRILISNPGKGGEGLNLQLATLQYFYSNSFMADRRLQAEDRGHRIGQTKKMVYKDLICKNTIDTRIQDVLKRKGNLIDYFRSGGDPLQDD